MGTKWTGIFALLVGMTLILLTTCGHKTGEVEYRSEEPLAEYPPFYTSPAIPETLFFMGEPVPLERFEVFESLDREMLSNCYFHSQTMRLIKLAPRYFSIIDPILKEEGIPEDFRYLAVAESSLNPRAVSPAGAAGIWQFMKGTAGEYGLEVNSEVDERYHVVKSTRAAAQYLKKNYRKYGDWSLVAAAYNAGPAAIDRHRERQKSSAYFDLLLAEETERYIFRILSFKLILENPENYGFRIGEDEKYPLLKTRNVEITGSIANLADYAASQGITYKTLKYYNPWLRDVSLVNKSGKRYIIEIPE